MIFPKKNDFIKNAKKGNVIPVWTEILADTETPVSAFRKTVKGSYAWLLESVESGVSIGRYSFIGFDPYVIFRSYGKDIKITENGKTTLFTSEDPLKELECLVKRWIPCEISSLDLPFWGGAVGFVSYDYVNFFERLPKIPKYSLGTPDLFFTLMKTLFAFDNLKRRLVIIRNVFVSDDPELDYQEAQESIESVMYDLASGIEKKNIFLIPSEQDRSFVPEFEKESFLSAVEKIKNYIYRGDIFQAVISQRFNTVCDVDDFNIYRALRMINPSPYMFYLKYDDLTVLGSSPEVMVQKTSDYVLVRPIAGTRPRGQTDSSDRELEQIMKNDPKEKAEHLMLVDLGRNDIGRISVPGTVSVEDFMHVERYSHVMHMVTTVKGKPLPGLTLKDLIAATFPAGTVSGAPKIRAMEIIEELEPVRREIYAGLVGYLSFTGRFDSCITIRTIVRYNDRLFIQAGAGIVADSVPLNEYDEIINKSAALKKAIEIARGGLV